MSFLLPSATIWPVLPWSIKRRLEMVTITGMQQVCCPLCVWVEGVGGEGGLLGFQL